MDKKTMSRNVEFEIPVVKKKIKYEHKAPTDFEIMAFPDEVLLRIFKNLSTFDILRQIAPVCQRFYRLSKDPTLITEVTVENLRWWEVDRVDPRPRQLRRSPRRSRFNDTVYDVIRRSKNLVSLSIESRPDFKALLRIALENCPKFNRFRLIEMRIYDYDIVNDLHEVLGKSNIFF